MEIVNKLDIDGYRWEIMDAQARKDIVELKSSNEYSFETGREIILSQGFSADYAQITNINRLGKLIVAVVRIINLRGEGMDSDNLINFANMQIKLIHSSPIVIFDTVSGKPFFSQYDFNGYLTIYSSRAIEQGNNYLCFNLVSFEKK